MKSLIFSKSGVAFLSSMVILAIIGIVIAGMSLMASQDIHTVRRLADVSKANYLAESGIEKAIQELYDNSFDFSGFPIIESLGDGGFVASIDTSDYATNRIVKISSTGTTGSISKQVRVMVKDTSPPITSLDYAALSGGQLQCWLRTDVTGDIHANSNAAGWFSKAMHIGLFTTIHGNASASGSIRRWGTVDGSTTSGADPVDLPPFDADFFNYYYELADDAGLVYNGNKTFTSAPPDGIVYVSGNLQLKGSWTFTGCIIATGNIKINPGWANRNGQIDIIQSGNYPALMSVNGNIALYEPGTINGLVYAGRKVMIFDFFQDGPVVINGACISAGKMSIKGGIFNTSYINYVEQSPPGLDPPSLTILGWSD